MPTASATSQLHSMYEAMTSLDRVLASLRRNGVDVEQLNARDLYERDLDCQNLGASQLLEVIAAAVSARRAPRPEEQVLDVGCGMGGPGRFVAERFGCSVTGIDLLPLRIEAAEALTKRTGLAQRITYRQADATDLPFEDETFTQAWMLDVGVHVRDKRAMFTQLFRVLRPGGLLVMHDQMGPLTRAMRPLLRQAPFVAPSLTSMIRTIEAAGLRLLDWQDTSRRIVAYFEQMRQRYAPLEPGPEEDAKPWRKWLRITADAYITTLDELGGRTGLLLAERQGTS